MRLQIFDRVKFIGGANSAGELTLKSLATQPAGYIALSDTIASFLEYWPFLIHDEATDDWEIGLYKESGGTNEAWANDTGLTATVSASYAGGLVLELTGEASTNLSWMVKATATYLGA